MKPLRFFHSTTYQHKPSVVISSCLNGAAVRYDGTPKTLTRLELLQASLNLIPICPEVAAGMAIPRPPIQLVEEGNGIAVIGRDDPSLIATETLQKACDDQLDRVTNQPICGVILKRRSPSCGLGSTPIHCADGEVIGYGDGVFAAACRKRFSGRPLWDEEQLHNTQQIEAFIARSRLVYDLLYADPETTVMSLRQHYAEQLGDQYQQKEGSREELLQWLMQQLEQEQS